MTSKGQAYTLLTAFFVLYVYLLTFLPGSGHVGHLVGRHHGELLGGRGRGQAPHGVLVAVPALAHEVGVLGVLVDVGEARVRLLVDEHLR